MWKMPTVLEVAVTVTVTVTVTVKLNDIRKSNNFSTLSGAYLSMVLDIIVFRLFHCDWVDSTGEITFSQNTSFLLMFL